MKTFAFLVLAQFAGIAGAATPPPVPASAALSWVNPTKAADGSALTGPQALTKVQVFYSTQPIPDNSGASPITELSPSATTYTHAATATNGATLYYRLRACNIGGCSPLSDGVSKQVNVSAPAAPSGVKVTVTVVVTVP